MQCQLFINPDVTVKAPASLLLNINLLEFNPVQYLDDDMKKLNTTATVIGNVKRERYTPLLCDF